MTISVNINGVWREVEAPSVNVGGVWQAVQEAYVRVNGVWQSVFTAIEDLAVSVSPVSISELGRDDITTDPVTANVTGGAGPFTYQWTKVSGGAITAITPNGQTTRFTANVLPFQRIDAVFSVTVTDTATGLTETASVSVSFEDDGTN